MHKTYNIVMFSSSKTSMNAVTDLVTWMQSVRTLKDPMYASVMQVIQEMEKFVQVSAS